MFDGLGDDIIEDDEGENEARCIPSVSIASDEITGAERIITFSTGGTVTMAVDTITQIWDCEP